VLGPEMRATGEVMGIGADAGWPTPRRCSPPGTSCPPKARSSSPWRIATSRWASPSPRRSTCSASISSPPTAPPASSNITRCRPTGDQQGRGGRRRHPDWIESGRVQLIVNTPQGGGRAPTAASSGTPPARWVCPASRPSPGRCRWRAASGRATRRSTSPAACRTGTNDRPTSPPRLGPVGCGPRSWPHRERSGASSSSPVVTDFTRYGAAVAKSVSGEPWAGDPPRGRPRRASGCSTASGSRTRESTPGSRRSYPARDDRRPGVGLGRRGHRRRFVTVAAAGRRRGWSARGQPVVSQPRRHLFALDPALSAEVIERDPTR
jgi:hypothetical protein